VNTFDSFEIYDLSTAFDGTLLARLSKEMYVPDCLIIAIPLGLSHVQLKNMTVGS
jgi:hypothetical protein